MLDQNTDRMWYVIGAVIVGAAIILILNKTFPQLFASVGETFQSKTEQTTEVVDGISPKSRYGPNLVYNAVAERTVHNSDSSDPVKGDVNEKVIHYTFTEDLKPSTQYEMSFEYKTTTNVSWVNAYFLGNDPESTRTDPPNTKGEWKSWTYIFSTKDPVQGTIGISDNGKRIRFDNNASKDGLQATLSTRRVSVREIMK